MSIFRRVAIYLVAGLLGAVFMAPVGGFLAFVLYGQLAPSSGQLTPAHGWRYHLVGGTVVVSILVGAMLGAAGMAPILEGQFGRDDTGAPPDDE